MKYLIMIQARCGSTRLSNKVLKDVCGKTVLQRIVERAQRSRYADEVVVVTSIDKNNLQLLRLCADMGVRVGVGSENDVLDRFYQTAKLFNPEYVIRLTADCPCFDAELLDDAIHKMKDEADYCGMLSETCADGLDFEIVKFSALEKAWKESRHSFEREHVTQYIIRHPEIFSLQDFVSPVGYFGNQRWTVDEVEDFEVVTKIYDYFIGECKNEWFGYKEILDFINKHPEVADINKMYQRNEGLQKSIREDRIVNIQR